MGSRPVGRSKSVLLKVGGALAFVGFGVGGGFLLHSPGERITYDLPPTRLTAQVTSQELSIDLTGSGVFQNTGHVSISAQAPADRSLVVTNTPLKPGEQVPWCGVLVEVSGRPIFLLQGDIPGYRDLAEEDSGQDVRQLQEALRACGYQVVADGEFGGKTAAAMKKLYADAGYTAVTDLASALGPVASQGNPVADPAVGDVATTSSEFELGARLLLDSAATPLNPETILLAATSDAQSASEPEVPSDKSPENGVAVTPVMPPKIYVPRGEIRFIKSAPKVLSQLPQGSEPQGEAIVQLSLVGDKFIASLPAEHITKVEQGQEIHINYLDWSSTAVLPEIPETPTYSGGGTPTLEIPISLQEPIPDGAYEQPGQFTITTGADQVFEHVVPVSAINQDVSGQHYVWKTNTGTGDVNTTVLEQHQAELERIDIRVLDSAGGYVAVEIVTGALEVGDSVVIGKK